MACEWAVAGFGRTHSRSGRSRLPNERDACRPVGQSRRKPSRRSPPALARRGYVSGAIIEMDGGAAHHAGPDLGLPHDILC
jgi:hypothetical protein